MQKNLVLGIVVLIVIIAVVAGALLFVGGQTPAGKETKTGETPAAPAAPGPSTETPPAEKPKTGPETPVTEPTPLVAKPKVAVVGDASTLTPLLPDYNVTEFKGVADYTSIGFSGYKVVIFQEKRPLIAKESQAIREYVKGGGRVALLEQVPACFGGVSCPAPLTTAPGISDWFRANEQTSRKGTVTARIDNPFGTAIKSGDVIFTATDKAGYGVRDLQTGISSNVTTLAKWDGDTFAFNATFYDGKIYYQGAVDSAAANTLALFKGAVGWLVA